MENNNTSESLHEIMTDLHQIQEKATAVTGRYASAIGKGLIAGLAGTAAITVSQMIEMKITGREKSLAPAKVANKALGTMEIGRTNKRNFADKVHWGYGSTWGAVRGVLKEAGMPSWAATATHFVGVCGTAFIMLPQTGVAPPLKKWGTKALAIEALHHGIYAVVTGLAYDALDKQVDGETALDEDEFEGEPEIAIIAIETDISDEPQSLNGLI